MGMAHHPVAELWVQSHGGQLVPVETRAPAKSGGDLRSWVEGSALPAGGMIVGGLALAGVGLALGVALPLSLGTAALFGGMVTFGGGVAFLGGLKRKSAKAAAQTAMLPPAPTTSPAVLNERARRVAVWLQSRAEATFEELHTALRWTESALVETLLHMKNSGILDEDLNLDSGQWVYRMQAATDTGAATSMMLQDRQARGH